MNNVNFAQMTTPQLVSFYNRHASKPVKKFSDRKTAERRCSELFDSLATNNPAKVMNQKAETPQRAAMKESLKLDRTIKCVETGETWKNAYRMWKEHQDWMTTSQQDRLTAQLYAAAKTGEQKVVTVNGRSFILVNVKG